MEKQINRKEFLQQLFFVGVASLAVGTRDAGAQGNTAKAPATKPADPCSDTKGLTDMELKMRNETLKYVADSPDPKKLCDNCKFWQPPTGCGTCQLIKGPIAPKGYCISWFTAAE